MRIIVVCGTWNEIDGKPSGFAGKIAHAMEPNNDVTIENGGNILKLDRILSTLGDYDAVCWWPNIDNSVTKFVERAKGCAGHAIFVTSKNNIDGKYSVSDCIARALRTRSNLLVEFGYDDTGHRFVASIYDPLGNVYLREFNDAATIALHLTRRIEQLRSYTRVPSVCVGEAIVPPKDRMELDIFMEVCRRHSDTFHSLIHAANSGRFLGNVSFRCESGFPAMNTPSGVWVSPRNVDKRGLVTEQMVAVEWSQMSKRVLYYGDHKPSVDAAIQLLLFQHYPMMRYMLHSHVYIAGETPMTMRAIPCGAIEEVDDVLLCVSPHSALECVCVNLRGHGSLVMSRTIDSLMNIEYVARPWPEMVNRA